MNPINWVIVVVWIGYVVWDGLRRSRGTSDLAGYFQASRSLPWWAVGLSVMATQLSAVTMIGTMRPHEICGSRRSSARNS